MAAVDDDDMVEVLLGTFDVGGALLDIDGAGEEVATGAETEGSPLSFGSPLPPHELPFPLPFAFSKPLP